MRGRKYPYYPWWVYDYNSDPLVLGMTDEQDLAYRRLLDRSWDIGPLPNETERLAALARYSVEKFKAAWTYPLTECWEENEDGFLTNSRLEKVRADVINRYEQTREAGRASVRSRRERTLNRRSTGVERALNDPKSNMEILNSSKNSNRSIDRDSSKGGGPDQRSADPAPPAKVKKVTGRVKWVIEDGKQKLEASDKFRAEFLACWKKYFKVEEIKEQIEGATRWLVPRPKRRGSKSRLDLYLHGWMENALKDKRNMEEEDERTASRVPETEPSKWCNTCRCDLPDHMDWCLKLKERKEHDSRGKEGTTQKPDQGTESGPSTS